jgi:hypothetical protein
MQIIHYFHYSLYTINLLLNNFYGNVRLMETPNLRPSVPGPEAASFAPPVEAAAVPAEAPVSAERAGRLANLGRKIGDVAMAGVGAVGEVIGRTADATSNILVGGARKVAETASNGYAYVKTTAGMAQAGVNPFAREATPVVPLAPGAVPPPPVEKHRGGFAESLGRSLRFNAILGGVAAGAVIAGKIAASRHGMEFGGTGGHGVQTVMDALPSPSVHLSGDSLPGAGHLNLELAAESSVGSNDAGNVVGNVLKGAAVAGTVAGAGLAFRHHRRHMRAGAVEDHAQEQIHNGMVTRHADARAARVQRNRTRRTGVPMVGADGFRLPLVDGTPAAGDSRIKNYDSNPRTPNVTGTYDPDAVEGRNIMRRGRRHNNDHPLGGH